MRTSKALICCAVACCIALSACSETTPEPAPQQQTVSLPVDAPKITLLDAGDGGQVVAFTPVAEQRVKFEAAEGFVQNVFSGAGSGEGSGVGGGADGGGSGEGAPSDTPESAAGAVDSTFSSTVSVSAGEGTDAALTFNDISADPDPSSAAGFTMNWTRAASGQVSSVAFAVPTGADDQARATVEHNALKLMSLPIVFPGEPIGVGARWTVENRVAGESAMLQTTTYTLVEVAQGRAELEVDVQQRPTIGAIPFNNGDGAAPSELRVVSSHTNSSGRLSIDLASALPVAGSVEYTTRVIYGGETPTQIIQDSSTAIRFSPTSAGAP